jgi:replication-associated recombination protein RarA
MQGGRIMNLIMFRLTKLYVFPAEYSAPDQLQYITSISDSSTTAVLRSADFLSVNLSEDAQSFEALPIASVRQLQLEVISAPVTQQYRIVLIGNLELASLPAQQALLKLLEEPPAHIQMIVTTTQKYSILETILSRCKVITPTQLHTSESKQELSSELLAAIGSYPEQSLTFHQAFELSEKYKERGHALQFVTTLLQTLHTHPTYPSPIILEWIKACLETTQQLEANVNTRLAVEQLLFRFTKHP